MDVPSSKHQPLLLLMRLRAAVAILCAAHAAAIHQPNPECSKTCGSIDIPFPFGITKDCALDSSFLIDCNKTTSSSNNSHTPYLPKTNTTVLSISLNDGELRVSWPALSECYANGTVINQTYPGILDFRTPFNVSTSRNTITGVGCDTIGAAAGWDSTGKRYTTGCLSFCDKDDNFTANGSSCPTTGCCEASIPGQGLWRFAYDVATLYNHSYVSEFSPCGHAFVAEKGAYLFESKDLWKFEKKTFPVVLDWTVGNHTCRQAMRNNASSYACKADNSICRDSTKGLGYLCSCSIGFRGNPYLLHGCQDVNECMESNDCVKEATCHNTPGGHTCLCRKGYDGDGKVDGKGCTRISRIQIKLIIALTKVSDFGASRIVPLDRSQVTTLVQGTLGYLDPEYFHTSQLTEKSDVYSFGVVLAELLTGRKALSFDMPEDEKNLAAYFIFSMEEGHLLNIVDGQIIDETKVEVLVEFANIAKQCLRLKGDERPTMKEVTMVLERLTVEEKHRWDSDNSSSKETENLLKASSSVFNVEDGTSVSGISFGLDTINLASMSVSLGGGR